MAGEANFVCLESNLRWLAVACAACCDRLLWFGSIEFLPAIACDRLLWLAIAGSGRRLVGWRRWWAWWPVATVAGDRGEKFFLLAAGLGWWSCGVELWFGSLRCDRLLRKESSCFGQLSKMGLGFC